MIDVHTSHDNFRRTKMSEFNIVEQFISINGEGNRAGELAYFIRFKGCNLNCNYCDTKWANEDNTPFNSLSEEEIYKAVKESNIKNITITGGEPLIQNNIKRLLGVLSKDNSLSVEVETNGSVKILDFIKQYPDVSYTVDYKLPDSGMEEFMNLNNFSDIRYTDVIKFVVSSVVDLKKALLIINKYQLLEKTTVYLSSSFQQIHPKEIVDFMIKNNMNRVKLQLQLHKYIWSPNKKGV